MLRKIMTICGAATVVATLTSGARADLKGSFFVPGLQVSPVSGTEFEILEGRSEGARTYWCAAAFHAVFTLGRESGDIYLSRAFGPARTIQGMRAVAFSLTPTPEVKNPVSLSIRQEGARLAINHALQFCRDSDLEADN